MPVTKEPHRSSGAHRDTTLGATHHASDAVRYAHQHPTAMLPEIVSFTTLLNVKSRAVMERIGMHNANKDFEHPGVPPGHPQRMHCLYRLRRTQWRAGNT